MGLTKVTPSMIEGSIDDKLTYSMILGAPVNVLDFGAVGDGVADDTAAIQAAITFLTANDLHELYFPPGTYNITQAITFANYDIFINGPEASIVCKFPSSNVDVAAFSLTGGWNNQQTVSASTSTTATVTNGSVYSANDVVKIKSSAVLPISPDEGIKGEFAVVKSVSGNVITFQSPLLFDYSADSNVYLAQISNTSVNVVFDKVTQTTGGNGAIEAVYLEALKNCNVYINEVTYANRGALSAVSCYGGKVEVGSYMSGGVISGGGATIVGGYGVVPTSSEYMTLRLRYAQRIRHAYDCTGNYRGALAMSQAGASSYNTFESCTVSNNVSAPFAVHQGSYANKFIDCFAVNCPSWFSFRGQKSRVIGGGADGCTDGWVGAVVGTSTPNGITKDNVVENAFLRNGSEQVLASSGDLSGLLTVINCDIETTFTASNTRAFSPAGDGFVFDKCNIKISTTGGAVLSGIVAMSASVDNITFKDCTIDLSGATVSSSGSGTKLITNNSGGSTISTTVVFTLQNLILKTPTGFKYIFNDPSLPTAASRLNNIYIRGDFTAVGTDFVNADYQPYVDGPVVYNGAALLNYT